MLDVMLDGRHLRSRSLAVTSTGSDRSRRTGWATSKPGSCCFLRTQPVFWGGSTPILS
ncbi:hypothetical protein CKA32_003994 [Geitlerinema sp. FC II]|nr:hypothetical protein CKA32_003994 [Geitlerinema sp. FC II]